MPHGTKYREPYLYNHISKRHYNIVKVYYIGRKLINPKQPETASLSLTIKSESNNIKVLVLE